MRLRSLVRDNADDPKVIADLELLARAYEDDAPDGVSDVASEGASDVASAAPLDDRFRSFVAATVHVRGYFPYYLGAAAWLVVMLLMQPVGDARPERTSFASPRTETASPAGQVEDVPAPPADGGFVFDAGSAEVAIGVAEAAIEFAAADAFSGDEFASSGPVAFIDFGDDGDEFESAEPEPLRVVKTGYSSATGGTPVEREPPGGGLPVAAGGGHALKRSFVSLAGDMTTLRLKLVDDPSNVGAEEAAVRMCPIVAAEWDEQRGVAFDDEPTWAEPCVPGTRHGDGTWTWDLSSYGAPSSAVGFTLTADGLAPFNLTFNPNALRPEG